MPPELPPPDHDPARAREAADEILSRPEYRWSPDDGVLDRIGEWFGDQLDRLGGSGPAGGDLAAGLGVLVLALLVALVAILVWRSRAAWRRDRPQPAAGRERVVVSGHDDVDWEAEAARCEAEGRWREALRARYRVLVGNLAARRVLGDLVGRTAGELVAEVRTTAPGAASTFAAATAVFEAAWYGGEAAGPAERDRFAELAAEVLAATVAGTPA